MKRFFVVLAKDDGGVELIRMKKWLRNHPDQFPPGMGQGSTSHQLRNAFRKLGWTVEETETEVRLLPPGLVGEDLDDDAILGPDAAEEEIPEAYFGLEYQLRDFIAQNLESVAVGAGKLSLFLDQQGRDGVEYPTDIGPIDILGKDEAGSFYVFELKRARSPDHALGQLARYMGWVTASLSGGREVYGIIVAREVSKSLRYAVSVIPNVKLFEYKVQFHLQPAHDLPQITPTELRPRSD